MCFFRCKNETYKNIFLKILGWKNFCECDFGKPYLHTHILNDQLIYKPKVDSSNCNCDSKYYRFDHAIFGKEFSVYGNYKQIKIFKCMKCGEETEIDCNLKFDSEITIVRTFDYEAIE